MTIINAQLGGDRHEDLIHSKLCQSGVGILTELRFILSSISIRTVASVLGFRHFTLMEERCDVPMRLWGNLKQLFKERIKAFRQLCTPGQAGSTMVPTVRVTTARTLMELLAA